MSIPVISGATTATWKALVNTTIGVINAAFAKRPYVWADSTARLAQTGMTAGEYGRQTDTGVEYRATSATATVPWSSDWISWATAPTNLTVGTGGSAATVQRYKWISGRIYFDYRYVLGTTGFAVSTPGPTLNLPMSVYILNPQGGIATSDGAVYDVSAVSTPAFTKVVLQSATTARVLTYNGSTAAITATAPMTWAAGDILAGGFWADPA